MATRRLGLGSSAKQNTGYGVAPVGAPATPAFKPTVLGGPPPSSPPSVGGPSVGLSPGGGAPTGGPPSGSAPTAGSLPQTTFQFASSYYNRPKSALDQILRVLRVPENIVVGMEYNLQDSHQHLAPWAWMKAIGKGFTEIPSFVGNDLTFDDFVRETNDPNSFWYHHANVIGLGLSVFYDPTTYLTFGTTGASKIAAKGALASAWRNTAREAQAAIASGSKHYVIGKAYSFADDIDTVMAEIHAAQGRPFTLGDSLEMLRKIDKAGQGGTGPLGNALRVPFARGGQGIRFAGVEVPGSRAVTESFGRTVRKTADTAMSRENVIGDTIRGIVPDAKLASITQDARRALALVEFNNIDRNMRFMGEKFAKSAADIARTDKVQGWTNPLSRQIAGIFGKQVEYIPQATRKGLLRQGGLSTLPKGTPEYKLVQAANLRKATIFKMANDAGLDQRRMDDLNDLWGRLVKDIDDPVEVVAQFTQRAGGRLVARGAVRQILDNPLLARRVDEELSTLRAGTVVKDTGEFAKIIGQKAKPFSFEGRTYAVSDAVGEALEQLKNPAFIDVEMSKWFKRLNGAQQLWKIPATVLNPAFHLMNMVGGMWNNMLAGPYGPFDYMESWARIMEHRILAGESRGLMAGPGLATVRGLGHVLPNKGLRAFARSTPEQGQGLVKSFIEKGEGGGAGFVGSEMSASLARDTARHAGDRPLGRRALTAARRTTAAYGAAQIGLNVASSQGWVDDTKLPYSNELWGVVGFLPELARLGRKASTTTEEVLRMTPFQETWKNRGYRQLMEAMGPVTPPNFAATAPKGLTKRQEAALFDIGTEMAVHFQFDYSKLSPMERFFAKTIFPFWVFYKNNFLLQAGEVAQRPRFVDTFYDTANALQNYSQEEYGDGGLPPEMEALLPEYFSKLGAFQVPVPAWARSKLGLPADAPLFLNPKLPFVSLNLFPPFWELFNNRSVTPFWQRALQVASPVTGSIGPFAPVAFVPGAKLMFEAITGTNLGLAQPIDYRRAESSDWDNSYTEAPGYVKYLPKAVQDMMGIFGDPDTGVLKMNTTVKYVMDTMSSPFITNYGQVIPTGYAGARSDKARADLVSWMTGLRLMPVDFLKIQRSWGYRLQSMLEARQSDMRARGSELEFTDKNTLRLLRRHLKTIEKQWDQRNVELYGSANH